MAGQQGTASGNGASNNSSPPEFGPDPNQYRFASYNPCSCSQDSTYSANYSGTSVEERSGYTSTGTGVSDTIEFYSLGGALVLAQSAGPQGGTDSTKDSLTNDLRKLLRDVKDSVTVSPE